MKKIGENLGKEQKAIFALLMALSGKRNRKKHARLFLMLAMNMRVEISLEFKKYNPAKLVEFGGGVVTAQSGNTDLPNPPDPLGDITTACGALDLLNKKISGGDLSKATRNLRNQKFNSLCDLLETNAGYVANTANRTAAGDYERALQIANSSGHVLQQKGQPHGRSFEKVRVEDGTVHVRAVRGGSGGPKGHLWRYGLTTAKGVVPTSTVTQYSKQVDMVLTDIPSKSIIAVQHANIELAGHVKKWGHPTFSFNTPDPYDWSDWIYIVVP